MDNKDLIDLHEKLEKMEDKLIQKMDQVVSNQADKQKIICENQCRILNKLMEKVEGNGKPGLCDRVNLVERSVKAYNWVLGIIITSGVGFLAIDIIKKWMHTGITQ